MRNIVIGTAGHIDHGKTTLIKYLTGKDTDTLPEEKKRGITIDLGFSFLETSENKKVGIIDVPGHEKFIKNMTAGASGIDYIIFVVALDDGVMPQTREHFNIVKLLGIKHGIIVLTKSDLVDEKQKENVKEEIKFLVKNSFLENAKIFETSTKDINSYKNLKKFLIKDVENVEKEIENDSNKDFRMYVDRVFSVKGFGTVITGTVLQGKIKVNDFLNIYPLNSKVRVKGIENHGIKLESIESGNRCALNISNVEKDEIKRGDIVSTISSFKSSNIIDVVFEPLKDILIKNNEKIKIHFGTKEITGKIRIFTRDSILVKKDEEIEKYPAQIYLDENVALIFKEYGIIRSCSPVETIGGVEFIGFSTEKKKKNDIDYAQHILNIYKGNVNNENKKDFSYLKNILEDFHEKNHLEKGILRIELKNKYFEDFSFKEFKEFINESIEKNEVKSEVILDKEYISLKEYKIKLTLNQKRKKQKQNPLVIQRKTLSGHLLHW